MLKTDEILKRVNSEADKWLEAMIVERLPDSWVRATTLF